MSVEIMPATKAIASFKLPTSTLARSDKGHTITAHMCRLDALKRTSGVAEVCRKFSTNENTITVGGLYAVDPFTSAKYRLSNRGKFAALMLHELKLKSS
ncbi:hypothetical protein C5167_004525 [Papaver somniferum]|uniref:Uncharacterized protein n=1 Tax=Papaver somniferum TaxID=3469 RepID=A0A4Y7J7U9_PAPSO|nr:hypothetical protein C5167_004525 [Papaver somniferum]